MATLIAIDGTRRTVKPRGTTFTLEELYEYVETDIVEMVRLQRGRLMWLDEEGKLREPAKPVNETATRLLVAAGGSPSDYVVGPVLVTEPGEVD